MENWTWGLSLIALTVGFHVSGVVFMALTLHSIGVRVESQSLGLRRLFAILTGLIGTVGLLLAVLHGIEAGFWAAAYWWLDALASPGPGYQSWHVVCWDTRGSTAPLEGAIARLQAHLTTRQTGASLGTPWEIRSWIAERF